MKKYPNILNVYPIIIIPSTTTLINVNNNRGFTIFFKHNY